MSTIFYTESTPLVNNNSGAASAVACNLTPVTGRTAYINGFVVSGLGATAGSAIAVTVTGTLGGTQTYYYTVATGVTTANPPMQINFPMPVPATGPGVTIAINVPSFGAGNTVSNVVAYGYQK